MARETVSVVTACPGPDRAKATMAALERAGVEHQDVVLLNERTVASGRGR